MEEVSQTHLTIELQGTHCGIHFGIATGPNWQIFTEQLTKDQEESFCLFIHHGHSEIYQSPESNTVFLRKKQKKKDVFMQSKIFIQNRH